MKTSMFKYALMLLVLFGCVVSYITGYIEDPHAEVLFDNYPDKIVSPSAGVTNISQMTTKAPDKMDCVFSCTSRLWCRSINFKLQSEIDKLHICELLSSTSAPDNLIPAEGFIHLSMKNKCDSSPCVNHGSCYPDYHKNDYHCECNGTKGKNCEMFYNSCSDLLSAGYSTPGIYHINPGGKGSLPVFCDSGGWTVIQRNRKNTSVSFNHGWQTYKTGFGNLTSEFWLGLEKIHQLTKRQVTSLRVDLEDGDGNERHAEYSSFSIADESDFYRLNVNGYSGTAGDSISTADNPSWVNNNAKFSTPDKDNDGWPGGSCAAGRKAGWWYGWCSNSELNGAMTWWKFNKIVTSSEMKLK